MSKTKRKEYIRNYHLLHKEEIKAKRAKYYLEHKEEIREKHKKWCSEHKEQIKISTKKYLIAHRENIEVWIEKYKIENKEQIKKRVEKWRITHQEEIKQYRIIYSGRQKGKNKESRKAYLKKKRLADPLFKMIGNIRNRTCFVFKKMKLNKPAKTEELLGADFKTVMFHIESQFTFGMSWEKVGKEIHIDHKKPLAKAKTEKQLLKLCHYTNLQPLWAEDNLRKQDNLNYTVNNI